MKSSVVQEVTKKLILKYPKIRDKAPKVTQQSEGKYLLTYNFSENLPGNRSLEQSIRAVIDEAGNILKISSSRG